MRTLGIESIATECNQAQPRLIAVC